MLVQALLVFFLCIAQSEAWLYKETLASEINGVFKDLQKQYPDTSRCLLLVKRKLKELGENEDMTDDRAASIGLANLYTQECRLEGNNDARFYSRLNSEMRTDRPYPFWEKTAKLLDRAMNHLTLKSEHVVYRGMKYLANEPEPGENFAFKQHTSTSTNAGVAHGFSICSGVSKYFLQIFDVSGLDVKGYSAFNEAEFLLKYSEVFEVISVSKNVTENELLLEAVKVESRLIPEVFIVLVGSGGHTAGKRSVGRTRTREKVGPVQNRNNNRSSRRREQTVRSRGSRRRGQDLRRPCIRDCYMC